jgi:hypothetical protein
LLRYIIRNNSLWKTDEEIGIVEGK